MDAAITRHVVVHHVDDTASKPTGLVTVEKLEELKKLEKSVRKVERELPRLEREISAKEREIIRKLT